MISLPGGTYDFIKNFDALSSEVAKTPYEFFSVVVQYFFSAFKKVSIVGVLFNNQST